MRRLQLCLLGLAVLPALQQGSVPRHQVGRDSVSVLSPKAPLDSCSALFCYSNDHYPGEFLLHFHMVKCGGTSLYRLFDPSNCGRPTYSFDGGAREAALDFASRMPLAPPSSCRFFSFEFDSLPALLRELAPSRPPARILTIVRKPAQQILSLFRHIRKYLKFSKCKEIADVVSGRCKAFNFSNMQVQRLGDGSLVTAMRNLESMFWFGVFEYYDTSLCLLALQLDQFSREKCSCDSRAGHVPLIPVSMSTNRSRIDLMTTYQAGELEELVALDNVLYQFGVSVFMRRVASAEERTGTRLLCRRDRDVVESDQLRAGYRYFSSNPR